MMRNPLLLRNSTTTTTTTTATSNNKDGDCGAKDDDDDDDQGETRLLNTITKQDTKKERRQKFKQWFERNHCTMRVTENDLVLDLQLEENDNDDTQDNDDEFELYQGQLLLPRQSCCTYLTTRTTPSSFAVTSGEEETERDDDDDNNDSDEPVNVDHTIHRPLPTTISSLKATATVPATTLAVPNRCVICLDSYQPGDCVVWSTNVACEHAFHRDCLVKYFDKLQRKRGETPCPCCRERYCPDLAIEVRANPKHRSRRRRRRIRTTSSFVGCRDRSGNDNAGPRALWSFFRRRAAERRTR